MHDYQSANDAVCLNLTELSVPPCQGGAAEEHRVDLLPESSSSILTVRHNRMSSA